MKKLRLMDSTGDSEVTFDEADAKSMAEARALFERVTNTGGAAFAVSRAEGLPDKRLADFAECEAETLLVPRIVGG